MSTLKKQDIKFALELFRWMDNPSNGFSTTCAPDAFLFFKECLAFFFLDEKMKKKFKAFVEELRKNGATRYDISTMKKEKRKVLHRNVITWLTHIFKVKQPKIIYIIKKKN